MAKSRWGAPRYLPPWPYAMVPLAGAAVSFGNTGALDAVGEKIIFAGRVRWADGGTHDLRTVRWRSGNQALTGGTLTVSARNVDLTAGPPLRDDGGVDQSTTHTNPAADTNFTSTFGADRTNVATGDLLAIVFEVTARTAGTAQIAAYGVQGSSLSGIPQVTSYLGAAYGQVSALPTCTLVAADGTLGMFEGGMPQGNDAAASIPINVDSASFDELAFAYTPTEPCWAGSIRAVLGVASGADFDLVLYEGTTAIATVSVDANTIEAAGVNEFTVPFADLELDPSTTYYVSMKPTTTNFVTMYVAAIPAADIAALFPGCMLAIRLNGGAWTPVSTLLPIKFEIGLVAGDDGAGSGGGAPVLLGGGLVR